jgi:hypothetical protein
MSRPSYRALRSTVAERPKADLSLPRIQMYRRSLGFVIWHSNPVRLSWSNVNIETEDNLTDGALCLECHRLDDLERHPQIFKSSATDPGL